MRDDRQELVAGAVAKRVVDALEVIQVHVHERAAREPGGRGRQLLRQAVAEQRAVGQLRERIVVRLAVQALVARAVGQGRAQALGKRRAVVGHRRVARRLAVVSHDEQAASRSSSTTGHNQKNSAPQSRIEVRKECRDSSIRAMVSPSGDSRTVAIIAWSKVTRCTGNSSAPSAAMNRRPCECAVGSSSTTPTHWLRVSSRNFGSTMSSARSISLAASSARSTSPSTSKARQSRCRYSEVMLNSRSSGANSLDGEPRHRLETAFAQPRQRRDAAPAARQVTLGNDRGDRECDQQHQRQQAQRRRHQRHEGRSRKRPRARTPPRCWRPRRRFARRHVGHGAAPLAARRIPGEDGGAAGRIDRMRHALRRTAAPVLREPGCC